jgi:hypothetical protein
VNGVLGISAPLSACVRPRADGLRRRASHRRASELATGNGEVQRYRTTHLPRADGPILPFAPHPPAPWDARHADRAALVRLGLQVKGPAEIHPT